jgi:uncharacterized protein (DUF2141 family)
MRDKVFAGLLATCLVILPNWAAWAEETAIRAPVLLIEVTGLRSAKGDVHYALYDDAQHFPERKGRIMTGNVPARTGGVVIPIKNLSPGIYAVAVYHDENRNDEFDQGFLGFPLEDYGFSNNASGFLGPPSFEDAAIKLGSSDVRVLIRLGE